MKRTIRLNFIKLAIYHNIHHDTNFSVLFEAKQFPNSKKNTRYFVLVAFLLTTKLPKISIETRSHSTM